MDYIETKFTITPFNSENCDIISALLGEIGYESFLENEASLSAYIPNNLYAKTAVENVVRSIQGIIPKIDFESTIIADRNWNEEWEKNFDPIIIDETCLIKAPFHNIEKKYPHEIIIEPKMSFGTGHHATTSNIIRLMGEVDFTDKTVLDMGCGTGVLGIYASQKGAKSIVGIDIDSWSYENTIENAERNNITNLKVIEGDASLLTSKTFNVILANINRNILLNDMHAYEQCMNEDSLLLLSGFYTEDLPLIQEKANELGLTYIKHLIENNWVAALFKK